MLAAVLVASVLGVVVFPRPATAALNEQQQGAAKPSCPDSRADEVSALATARLCGKRVGVDNATTEQDQVFATPEGLLHLEHHVQPVRVRRNGAWTAVNANLTQAGDRVVPVASAADMSFSAGGSGPLVTLVEDGKPTSISSPVGDLPKPTLQGTAATYAEVLPGVDLVVDASVTGFAEQLVVKHRQAAQDPRLDALEFVVKGQGTAVRGGAGGDLKIVDAAGAEQFVASTPVMWDASVERAEEAGQMVPSVPAETKPADIPDGAKVAMTTEVVGDVVRVRPNQAVLDDAATEYPVRIDPGFTAARGDWAYVDSGHPGGKYWNDNKTDMRAGTYNGGANKIRSYFVMDTGSTLTGRQVQSATLRMWETWAYSCQPRGIGIYEAAGAISPNTNWNNQPGSARVLGWYNTALGNEGRGCGDGELAFDVTAAMQNSADHGWPGATFLLKADDEGDNFGWKRFANDPVMDVVFNAAPDMPSNMTTSPSTPCITGGGRPGMTSKTPTLRVTTGDVDGGNVNTFFEWATATGVHLGDATVNTPAGAVATAKVPDGVFAEGSSYAWRTISNDGISHSAWSPWCEFTIDTVKPMVPFVGSSTYPSVAETTSWGHGGAGQAGVFQFRSAAPPPNPAGAWALTGAGSSVADSAGVSPAHPLTVGGGASLSASAASFDGTGYATADGPVVDTSTSFSVSAWVKVDNLAGFHTAVSVGDGWASGFFLQYDAGNQRWDFARPDTEDAAPAVSRALSTTMPQVGVWTHLAGAYDAAAHTMTLFVNGQSQGVTTGVPAGWRATGPLTVGRARWGAGPVDGWQGQVADVRVYQRAITPAEIGSMADVGSYTYQLDTATAGTTVDAVGNPTTVSITPPEDGRHTVTVRAKDRAENLSEPATYVFNVGKAGLTLPAPGANVVKRMKLAVDADGSYNQVRLQYRRGPGAAEHDIPLANLTTAAGGAVSSYPVALSTLGDHAVWNAVDTLGTTGGVVQVRAVMYEPMPAAAAVSGATSTGYTTQWVTVTVDPDGDGASGSQVGPGSVNLLTGDYSLSSTDVDEFGLSVQRAASSRQTSDGWVRQGERLPASAQQITDVSAFDGEDGPIVSRVTDMGQGSSKDALKLTVPATSWHGAGDFYVGVGGQYQMALGMKAGHRYRMTGWIYVPAETGLTSVSGRGLRITGHYLQGGAYHEVTSVAAGWVDGWQELSVDMDLPADATQAFFRLYNGMAAGSNKSVFFDNLSVTELVAPYGPQWRGGATGGVADVDYQALSFPEPELAKIDLVGGGWVTFARSASGQFFAEPGAEDLSLAKTSDTAYQLTETDGTVTEFTAQGDAWPVTATWTPDSASTTRYLYDTIDHRNLVKRVINPQEPGVGDCTTATPARGCEVLEYDYATTTTATATTLGDVTDRVRSVKVWSWDPTAANGAGAETSIEVAHYAYDDQGRLRQVWDPRLATPLKTRYDYDQVGHVTTLTPTGQLPWSFDYASIDGDGNTGRLQRVRRAALKPGSKDVTDGEIATNVVYQVPLTKTAGGPQNLDAASLATWGQHDVPTDATAVFGPESAPGTNLATTAKPGTGGYDLATVTYLNASAQTVNTLTPGGHIDSQTFDQYGNTVWSLEATNRELALGLLPDSAERVAELNLPAGSADRAGLLATVNTYSFDGLDLTQTLTPLAKVALERDIADPTGTLPTITAGTQVLARGRTTHVYDQGKPDGATYHLETTKTTGAAITGYPDADTRTTRTGYDAAKGGTSGWQLKKPTSTTTDAGTTFTVYDAAGRVTKSWGIGADGTDARTTVNIGYTAGPNGDDAACGNKPEWAGQPCVTRAAGAIVGADPTRMATTLPVKRVEAYTRFGKAAIMAETSAGKTRRTTTSYDDLGRVVSTSMSSDDGSAAVATTTTDYDPSTGQAVATKAGSTSITRAYDLLGRQIAYTDAEGATTRTEFDRYDRPTKSIDPTGSQTLVYDRTIEPRGMLTSVTDSVAGTFTARYSPDGQLTKLTYPGGVTRTDTLDANFQPTSRIYVRDRDGQTIYAESTIENTASQQVSRVDTGGSSKFGYDTLGRLTQAARTTVATGCVTRTYAYDTRTNRTAKRTYQPGATGCRSDGAADAEDHHSYDTADRLTDPGYVYDAFGRITTTPGGVSNTFYVNDLVATQSAGEARQSWTLDPAGRFGTSVTSTVTNTISKVLATRTNHYADESDSPRWIEENVGDGTMTRNVAPMGLDLLAITSRTGDVQLQLANLHGDVALTVDTGLTSLQFYAYDEFGNPEDTISDNQRYGWLGGKQRSTEALGDTILMGVRLYAPGLGRFLSMDPVVGGSCNAYDYGCADPINNYDLDGRFCLLGKNKGGGCRGAQTAKSAWNGVRNYYNENKAEILGLAATLVVGGACYMIAGSLAPATAGASLLVGAGCGALAGAAKNAVAYKVGTPKSRQSTSGFWKKVALGAVGGAVTGAFGKGPFVKGGAKAASKVAGSRVGRYTRRYFRKPLHRR